MDRVRTGSVLLLGLVTGLVVPLLLLLTAVPGSGQTVAGRIEATTLAGGPQLHLRSVTPWVGPVGTFRAEVLARDLPAGSTITFTVQQAVRDRVDLDRSITGTRAGAALLRGNAATEPDAPSTSLVSFPVTDTWPTPEGGIVLGDPGVYPVLIEAVDEGGSPITSIVTQLIRLPDATTTTPPLAVGLVIEQRQPQSLALDGSPYLDDGATGALVDGIRVLDAFPSVPFTTLPMATTLVDASSAGGTDPAVFGVLRSSATHQSLASTYAPIALDSWSDAGLTGEVDTQFSSGRSTVAGLVGSVPGNEIAVLDRTIGTSGLDVIADHGASAVIVPSDQLLPDPSTTPAPTRGFDVRSGSGRRLHALAADTAVSMRLLTDADPAAGAQSALAELTLISLANRVPAQGLAVIIAGTTPPETLRTLLQALSDRDGATAGDPGAPLLGPVRLDDLFTVTDVAISYDTGVRAPLLRPITADEPTPLGSYPEDLRATRRSIDGLSATVPESPSLVGAAIHRSLASGDRGLSEQERSSMLASAQLAIRSVTDEIVMTPEQIVTLTSRSGKVPLNIENRLQVPAHVHVSLRSAKLDFPDGAEFDQVLAPGTTTRIDARVTTRASGAFPLEVLVSSPDSTVPITRARFTVRSTAVSGIGLVLSIGAGLFLLLWWLRHYRTARRATRLMSSEHPATAGSSSPSATAEYARPDDSNLGDR
jgi:hypothetical protein